MKRLDLTGFARVNDGDVMDCLRDLNNVVAKYAGPGNYSLEPVVSVVEEEQVGA